MMLRRRALIQSGVAMLGCGIGWRLWAAPSGPLPARCLVVFQRGACDGLTVLVPYTEPFYYEARPHIAIAPPLADATSGQVSVALDNRWALHPSIADAQLPLWEAGQIAFVPFAGTAFVSRSHFQAQDWVEFGQPTGPRPDGRSGFLNRLIAELGVGPSGISFSSALPPVLRGDVQVANAPMTRATRRRADSPDWQDRVQAMYTGHVLEPLVRDGIGLRREIAVELQPERQTAAREAAPAGSFALEAARIGRLLRERPQYSVGFVDIGGWDTHAAQGAASGPLATRLGALASGLAELSTALGPREWERTVVIVMTEFGRTFRENGSRGTDHGHGATMWVLGGRVRGGAVRGEQASLGPGRLHEDRDVPVLNEYRATLAGLMARIYGLRNDALDRVFPGARPVDTGVL
jgi:uncharacterized protein (DUF1501 family)